MTKRTKQINRCQALDMDGKQCKNRFLRKIQYHGDSEIYSGSDNKPGWVVVKLCREHLNF